VITSNRWLMYLVAVVVGFILILKGLTIYTDYLWFDSLGQAAVWGTMFWTKVVLGLVVAGLFFAFLYANLRFARRPLPGDVTFIGRRLLPEEEREQIEQYADRALLIFSVVGALMAGFVASAHWIDWLQFSNAVSFDRVDPLFNKDAGFYVFRLRFIEYVWSSLYYTLLATFVFSVIVHLYQEAIRLVGNTVQAIPRARAHVLGLLAAALLVKIYSYRLDQYDLLFSQKSNAFVGGPGWVDIHARLPVLYILMVAALACAIISLVAIKTRNYKLPAGAVGGLILLSLLGGTVYPVAMQRLVVAPNELERERPYIERNIEATNFAYKTHQVVDSIFQVVEDLDTDRVRENWNTIENIRLWDHRPLQRTFNQEQAIRAYYDFPDVDVDRYIVDGRLRQVMLAPRQINADKIPGARQWTNRHLLYTHGYGIALSPVNELTPEGLPKYWVGDLPPRATKPEIQVTRPNVYYTASVGPRLIEFTSPPETPLRTGEQQSPDAETGPGGGPGDTRPGPNAPRPGAGGVPGDIATQEFVIVNSREPELAYSRQAEANEGMIDNVYHNYSGNGGVQLTSFFRRVAFAARFRDVGIIFTDRTTSESRIQINRTLPERLMDVAPFLRYDPDPYLVVAEDGKLKWINDAYTISGKYPYSHPLQQLGMRRLPPLGNYFRNSVKVVVDAYEGIPEFYVADADDPLVQCFNKIFPTLFTPMEQMAPDMRRHIRYPQFMFAVQVGAYASYHVKDAQVFYQGEDRWAIPPEIYSYGRRQMEAYYVVIQLPDMDKPEFLLMMPLVLSGQEERVMVAWMAARCDEPNYGELIVYTLPRKTVYGPWQIESRISQNAEISSQITLWSQAGSDVIRGNLLVIPFEDSLLYVEPLYLEAEDTGLPEMRRIILAYGDSIVWGPSLESALEALFGRIDPPVEVDEEPTEPAEVLEAPTPGVGVVDEPAVEAPAEPREVVSAETLEASRSVLERVLDLDRRAAEAQAQGDFQTYLNLKQQQSGLLQELQQQLDQAGGAASDAGEDLAP
jgi:uncharacterized membrane protein (UPF0182 family)